MLSKALAQGRPKDERSYRTGKIILLVSFPVLTVGSAVQQPALCVGAWLGLLVGGLLVLGHVLATVGPPPSSRGPG